MIRDQRVRHITVIDRAAPLLRRQLDDLSLRYGEVPVMVQMVDARKPDGTLVAGFVPGYDAVGMPRWKLRRHYLMAFPSGFAPFFFLERLSWNADMAFVMDIAFAPFGLLSIEAVG